MEVHAEGRSVAYVTPFIFIFDSSLFAHKIMANYFSNHSASRFLANSSHASSTATATQSSTAASQTAQPSPGPRPRIPSSKHFSTTVNTSQPTVSKDSTASSTPSSATAIQVHPLRNTYVRIHSRVDDRILFKLAFFSDGYSGFGNNARQVIKL
jgi:hypothetical protein